MNHRPDTSVTTMTHHLLCDLDFFLEETLGASGFDGSFNVYTADEFRRLYNDAVESMFHYRHLLEQVYSENKRLKKHIDHLEQQRFRLPGE